MVWPTVIALLMVQVYVETQQLEAIGTYCTIWINLAPPMTRDMQDGFVSSTAWLCDRDTSEIFVQYAWNWPWLVPNHAS